jgi:hypothetical protein
MMPKTKKWLNITDTTEQWIKDSYPKASNQDAWKYKDRLNSFFEFLGLTDKDFVESYKRSKDRLEWSRSIGFKVVAYYNKRVTEGYSTNTARAEISTVRAFSRDNCTTLIIPRKKIAKAKIAKFQNEFTREDLSAMYAIADVRDKAILACGVCLGLSTGDFSELPRSLIEPLVDKARAPISSCCKALLTASSSSEAISSIAISKNGTPSYIVLPSLEICPSCTSRAYWLVGTPVLGLTTTSLPA